MMTREFFFSGARFLYFSGKNPPKHETRIAIARSHWHVAILNKVENDPFAIFAFTQTSWKRRKVSSRGHTCIFFFSRFLRRRRILSVCDEAEPRLLRDILRRERNDRDTSGAKIRSTSVVPACGNNADVARFGATRVQPRACITALEYGVTAPNLLYRCPF